MANAKHIVITGASSGLGAALALAYAAPGVVLGLMGRDEARLQMMAAACLSKGAEVIIGHVDVVDVAAMQAWLTNFDEQYPIDMLIANAGISGGMGRAKGEATDLVRRIFAVNVDGVLNTLLPIVPRMCNRERGQIAIISSLAGMRGLPSAPAYSASKAAVKHYGEALRGQIGRYGVRVSVVCPGYIKTPLTDVNDFYMPFLMSPEHAAQRIKMGLARNQSRIAFPRRLYWPLWFLSCLPPMSTDWFFAALPAKSME